MQDFPTCSTAALPLYIYMYSCQLFTAAAVSVDSCCTSPYLQRVEGVEALKALSAPTSPNCLGDLLPAIVFSLHSTHSATPGGIFIRCRHRKDSTCGGFYPWKSPRLSWTHFVRQRKHNKPVKGLRHRTRGTRSIKRPR